jgi:excisionase family DNA binding protein
MDKLLDIVELSEILGVTKATIYSWTSQNKIPHVKLGNRILKFREDEIREWIAQRSVSAEQSSTLKTRRGKRSKWPLSDDYVERIIHNEKEEALN